jgi:AcrR family transcriptional regulator
MTKKANSSEAVVPRKMRADAAENRERILEVAKDAFLASGPDVSMDEIAKLAKVGPGTLYRHFPTRDALVEAVYRTEVEKLVAAEKRFAESMTPIEALRAWMLLSVDYLATKQIIVPALNLLACGPEKVFEQSGPLLTTAIERLVKRAVASGDLRPDLEPLDLLRAIAGLSVVAPTADWAESAKKMVGILILGARPTA